MTEATSLEVVFPGDTNQMGTLFGGTLMASMDRSAFFAASRRARGSVVTRKVAELDFDSLGRDWRSEVIRTYDALGLELSAAALSEMEPEQRRSAGGQHERHATDLQAFAGA